MSGEEKRDCLVLFFDFLEEKKISYRIHPVTINNSTYANDIIYLYINDKLNKVVKYQNDINLYTKKGVIYGLDNIIEYFIKK